MVSIAKRFALASFKLPLVGRVWAAWRRERATIFMMHRFASTGGYAHGHDPEMLRRELASMRRSGVRLVSVDQLLQEMENDAPSRLNLAPTVAFTVDDGYRDFLEVGAPVFAAFDCPVTLFVAPDVIDGKTWFWWDQIKWIARNAAQPMVHIDRPEFSGTIAWGNADELESQFNLHIERLKSVSNVDRLESIQELARAAGVVLPRSAPQEFSVLSWDELRGIEKRGVTIGAHTMSHPILSRCSDDVSRAEIVNSIARVGAELSRPSRVFCYPNGTLQDFGEREMATLRAAGVDSAVSTVSGHIPSPHARKKNSDWRWQVPRFAYEERSGVPLRIVLGS